MAELEQCKIGEKEQVPHRKAPEPPVQRGVTEKNDDKDSDRKMVKRLSCFHFLFKLKGGVRKKNQEKYGLLP